MTFYQAGLNSHLTVRLHTAQHQGVLVRVEGDGGDLFVCDEVTEDVNLLPGVRVPADPHPTVAAPEDPAAAGTDTAGGGETEVVNVRVGLHHPACPQVQHGQRGPRVQAVDQQSSATCL